MIKTRTTSKLVTYVYLEDCLAIPEADLLYIIFKLIGWNLRIELHELDLKMRTLNNEMEFITFNQYSKYR